MTYAKIGEFILSVNRKYNNVASAGEVINCVKDIPEDVLTRCILLVQDQNRLSLKTFYLFFFLGLFGISRYQNII